MLGADCTFGLLNPSHVPDDISKTRLKSSLLSPTCVPIPKLISSLISLASHCEAIPASTVLHSATLHFTSIHCPLVSLAPAIITFFKLSATGSPASNSDSLLRTPLVVLAPKRNQPRKSTADLFMYSSSVHHFEHHLPLKLQTFRAPKPCSIHLRSCG